MNAAAVVPELVGWLFLVANGGRLLAYFPQIVAATRSDTGARSVSLLTWSYFAFAHFTAVLYAIFVLHDSRSIGIFFGNFLVTLILVAIVVAKRRRHRLARTKDIAPRDKAIGKPRRRSERLRLLDAEQLQVAATSLDGTVTSRHRSTVLRFGLQTVTLPEAGNSIYR